MDPIGVGIIGAGFSATTFHAPFITSNPAYNLVAFLRTRQTPVAAYPAVAVHTSLETFLSNPALSLVIVTSPSHSHYEHTKAAILAGKHVLVEKPFTTTGEEAKQLIELAKEKGTILTVYHNRRWDGDFLTLKRLVKDGTLGRVVEVEMHMDRFRNAPKGNAWREENLPGSGVFFDLGSHLIDQSLTLFGTPSHVTANIQTQRSIPSITTDDAFHVTLHYSVPASPTDVPLTVTLKATMLALHSRPRFLVNGTKGTFLKTGWDPQESQLKQGMLPTDGKFGVDDQSQGGELWVLDEQGSTPPGGAVSAKHSKVSIDRGRYDLLFENVAQAIRAHDSRALEVTAEQAATVIAIIEAAKVSSAEKRTVRLEPFH